MSDQIQQAEPTQEQATVQLQISDLLLTAQVIQLASQRGAFKDMSACIVEQPPSSEVVLAHFCPGSVWLRN